MRPTSFDPKLLRTRAAARGSPAPVRVAGMRFLFALAIAFAMAGEASARTDTLPPQFVGVWGRELEPGAQCYATDFGTEAAGDQLYKIDLNRVTRMGARCRFRRISRDAHDPSIIAVRLWCRGNRQIWEASYTWRLVDVDEETLLVMEGTPSKKRIEIYRRCRS
jgi:hypothetical protein